MTSARVYYGPDHRYWWVTELGATPVAGSVLELEISGRVRRYRVQRVRLVEASPETDAIDRLHVWTREIDIPGDWVPVPSLRDPEGSENFHRVISRDRWASVARGGNYLRRHNRPDPQQVYCVGSYLPTLGTWSGERDPDGEYLDSAPPEDLPYCPF